jgi:glutaredoxin
MITLYRTESCPACDQAQEALEEMVVAHKVVKIEGARPANLQGLELPVIVEGEKVVSGQAVDPYLAQLARDAELWRKFQSDACYINEDGSSSCK